MSLIKLLLEVNQRDIIINKIGLSEKEFDIITNSEISPKFHIFTANLWKKAFPTDSVGQLGTMNPFLNHYIKPFINIIQEQNRPVINLKSIIEINNPLSYIQEILSNWQGVKDYRDSVTPPRDLRNMEWSEAIQLQRTWHQEMANATDDEKMNRRYQQIAPNSEVIHTFDDGVMWIDIHENSCKKLGDAMKHCGNTSMDTILQLVSTESILPITVAFSYNGTYSQIKSKGNKKPTSEYEKYIEWLFTNGGDYQLKAKIHEYLSENDFNVQDLSDDNLRDELLEKYPSLGGTSVTQILKLIKEKKYRSKDYVMTLLNNTLDNYEDTYDRDSRTTKIFDFDEQYLYTDVSSHALDIEGTFDADSIIFKEKVELNIDKFELNIKEIPMVFINYIIEKCFERYGETVLKHDNKSDYKDNYELLDYLITRLSIVKTFNINEDYYNFDKNKINRFRNLFFSYAEFHDLVIYEKANTIAYKIPYTTFNYKYEEDLIGEFNKNEVINNIPTFIDFLNDEIETLDDNDDTLYIKELLSTFKRNYYNSATYANKLSIKLFSTGFNTIKLYFKPFVDKGIISEKDLKQFEKFYIKNQLKMN